MRNYLILACLLFLFADLSAEDLNVAKKPEPPMMVVDRKNKEVVKIKEKRKKEYGWHFVGGILASYGRSLGEDRNNYSCFPIISAEYEQEGWGIGTSGLGVESRYNFLDGALETYIAVFVGSKRNGDKDSDGYKPGVINNANYNVGVGAYFIRADYTYFPVKMIHPPIKDESLDAHFLELVLETPGFPIMIKPCFLGLKGQLNLSMMDDNFAKAYFSYYDKEGKPIFAANGGLHSFSYSLSTNLIINQNWMFMLSFSREYYLEDVLNSPITQKATTNSITSMIMYRF